MAKYERRFVALKDVEDLKIEEKDGALYIEGYPIVYGKRAVLWPGFAEVIMPGASTEALKVRNTMVYWNHLTSQPMAGFKNGTLEAVEDEKGVFMRAEVSGTVWGRQGHEAIKSDLVDQMSFGFRIDSDGGEEWKREENPDGSKLDLRIIHKFSDLPDFSPVSEPAYDMTEVYARSKDLICRNKPTSETSEDETSTEEDLHTPVSTLRMKLNHKKRKG